MDSSSAPLQQQPLPLQKQPQHQRQKPQQRRALWRMLTDPFGTSRQQPAQPGQEQPQQGSQQGSQQAQPLPDGQQLSGSQQLDGVAGVLQEERAKQAASVYGER